MRLSDILESVGAGGIGSSVWSEPTKSCNMDLEKHIPDDDEAVVEAKHPWKQSKADRDAQRAERELKQRSDAATFGAEASTDVAPISIDPYTQKPRGQDPTRGMEGEFRHADLSPNIELDELPSDFAERERDENIETQSAKKKRGPRIKKKDVAAYNIEDLAGTEGFEDIVTDEAESDIGSISLKDIFGAADAEQKEKKSKKEKEPEAEPETDLSEIAPDMAADEYAYNDAEEFRNLQPEAWDDFIDQAGVDPEDGFFTKNSTAFTFPDGSKMDTFLFHPNEGGQILFWRKKKLLPEEGSEGAEMEPEELEDINLGAGWRPLDDDAVESFLGVEHTEDEKIGGIDYAPDDPESEMPMSMEYMLGDDQEEDEGPPPAAIEPTYEDRPEYERRPMKKRYGLEEFFVHENSMGIDRTKPSMSTQNGDNGHTQENVYDMEPNPAAQQRVQTQNQMTSQRIEDPTSSKQPTMGQQQQPMQMGQQQQGQPGQLPTAQDLNGRLDQAMEMYGDIEDSLSKLGV